MSELKAFVLRTEVLHLFRNFLKTVKQAPADAKGDLRQLVRADFDRHRGAKDLYSIKYHLSDGRVQLKQLQENLAMKL